MTYEVPDRVRENAATSLTDLDRYREAHTRAAHDPDGFWLGITRERIHWRKPPTLGLAGSYQEIKDGPVSWFAPTASSTSPRAASTSTSNGEATRSRSSGRATSPATSGR
jgi:hypothetical protein